jgi:predicted KAP-like P-loop ATPase
MDSTDKHGFSSDRPIDEISEDLLGRSGFSQDLAKAISGWHGNDSLVVALHGDWGSGKSSIKNMAINELNKIDVHKPDVIEFSPWEWAAQDKITSSFFQEISSTVGLKDKSDDGKKLAKLLKRYGRYLNTGEHLASGISAALPTLFVLATIFGIGGNFADDVWVKNISTALLGGLVLWGACLTWGKKLLNILAGNTEATTKDEELTLNQLRSSLTDLLAKRDKTLVVVLDDLDRLTTKQLQMVFQLVKANTEFPNVVFVLLFQRDLVEYKLNDGKQTGRDYLEKIIQVPFDIPKIEQSRLHRVLFEKLDKILEQDEFAAAMFDSTYWGNLFHSSLKDYFSSLRNVYRFLSTFSFHFSLYQAENAFEVNPVDLIAIECLRVFEPDVYKSISEAKEFATKSRVTERQNGLEREIEFFNTILDKAKSGNKEVVGNLLKELFPPLKRLDNYSYAGGIYDTWHREMRVCHASNFDKYFLFSVPSGELSNSALQDMLNKTVSKEGFIDALITLKEQGILQNALSQFGAYVNQIPMDNKHQFIGALLETGDEVDSDNSSLSFNSSHISIVRLVLWYLRRIDSIEERGEVLLSCFNDPASGLSIVESILQADQERRTRQDTDLLLSDAHFDALKSIFVNKLDTLAQNNPDDLMRHKQLSSVIWRWKRWGNEELVQTWLSEQAQKSEYCTILLQTFLRVGSSQSMGDYVARRTTQIEIESIEEFFPVAYLVTSLSQLNRNELGKSEIEAIEAFEIAISQP